MIYVENTSNYPQRVYIPRDEDFDGVLNGYQFQKKDLDINHNGDYYLYPDSGYDGITASTIHVEVPTDTQEAYDQGYADGYAAGYSSGSTDGYASGHTEGYAEGYASGRTDGYAAGYETGYAAGYAAGVADQKAKLTQLTATTNGHYTSEDGYGDVYVNVECGGDYSSGYTDGMAAQKALLTSTTFTDNGHFEREDGWNSVDVRLNLPSLHTAITENGRVVYLPPAGAKGFDSVEIDVQVPQSGTGATLTAITATTNGEYYPAQYSADGFSQVTVAVDTASTYQEGYEDGETAQKAKLKELTATTNNHTYTDQDGYSAVTVSVDTAPYYNDGYNHGYSDGQDAQKGLLSSTAFTENGVYTSETGWSGVTVQLPLSTFEVTLAPNSTYEFDASLYGIAGFSSITAHTLNSMFHVLNVRFTTTAQNQTVEFTRANVAGVPNNISSVYVIDVGEFHSSSVVIENPGNYVANVYCSGTAPILQMRDNSFVEVEVVSGCTALDYLRLEAGGLANLTGITFESNSMVMAIPYGFYRLQSAQVNYFTVPDSVYDVASRAFEDADLYQVILGENVTSIGYKAFANNVNLTSVICKNPYGVHPSQNVFDQVPSGGTLIIPCGSTTAYSDLIAALPSGWNVVEDC